MYCYCLKGNEPRETYVITEQINCEARYKMFWSRPTGCQFVDTANIKPDNKFK